LKQKTSSSNRSSLFNKALEENLVRSGFILRLISTLYYFEKT